MKICVVTLFTEEIKNENYESLLNKKKYCDSYNLDYKFFYGRLSNRHAQWDKIQAVLQVLPQYDYVVWIDTDAVFNNFKTSLLELIEENLKYDGLFCHDVCYIEGVNNHLLMNAGVMIFKNSEWSFDFLTKVWNSIVDYDVNKLSKHSYDGFPWEQGKLCELLIRENSTHYKLFDSLKFNTHPNLSNLDTFIIHYMGSRETQDKLQHFVEEVKRINTNNGVDNGESFDVIELTNPKICIVTHYTDNLQSVADISIPNKKKYCKLHKYDLIVSNKRISKRHPGWDKILLLKEAIQSNKFDYVVWIDNDAFITNDQIRFDVICDEFKDKNLIVCRDNDSLNFTSLNENIDFTNLPNLRLINTGVFILKANDWAFQFLEEVWDTKSNTNIGIEGSHMDLEDDCFSYNNWPFEQGPFHIVLSKKTSTDYIIRDSILMNTHLTNHKKQHFICHFVGDGNNYKKIKNHMELLKTPRYINDIVKSDTHISTFKNNNVKLIYTLYKTADESNLLVFDWDYSKCNVKHLSHNFQIQYQNESITLNFGSLPFGEFFIKPEVISILHTYDFGGEMDWKVLYGNIDTKPQKVDSTFEYLKSLGNIDMLPQAHQEYLYRIRDEFGFTPKVIYDVGACVLHWTKGAKKVWPDSEYYLLEAMEESEPIFKLTDHAYHIGVLSDIDGKDVIFYKNVSQPGGNSYYKENQKFSPVADDLFGKPENQFKRKTITLDTVRKIRNFLYPDLLKIDVQGCELDILKGCPEILSHVQHLIVELQSVEYNTGAELFETSIPFIESLGFELVTPRFSMNSYVDGDYHFRKI